ncbi:YjjG family noncanonical pyrimidine nucleotidase [Myroides sp. LJL115]
MKTNKFEGKTDIFFDLDHTLWDFEKNSALAFDKVIQELELPFSSDKFLHFYKDINEEYWDKYSLNLVTREQLRVGRITDTFLALNHASNSQQVDQVGELYLNYLPEFNHLLSGAEELLIYLKPKYGLHIITNGFGSVQQSKLKNAGILDYFSTVTDSENAGVKKPDARIFNYALDSANTKVNQAVMVGDNLLADVQGAIGVGMDVIYYNEGKKPTILDVAQVHDLTQIKLLL